MAADGQMAGGQWEVVRSATDNLKLALKWMLGTEQPLLTLQSDTACVHLLLDTVLDLRNNPLVEGLALAYCLVEKLGMACTDAVLQDS